MRRNGRACTTGRCTTHSRRSSRRPPGSSPRRSPAAPRSRSSSSRASVVGPLYCYRPLTGRFIASGSDARSAALLPARRRGLEGCPTRGYLQPAAGGPAGRPARRRRRRPEGVPRALWDDVTDFVFDAERFDAAYADLEAAAYAGVEVDRAAAGRGPRPRVRRPALGDGLALLRGYTLRDAPAGLRDDPYATVARWSSSPARRRPALEAAGRRLRRLQTALRLWDAAEPALGPPAWARTDAAGCGAARRRPAPSRRGLPAGGEDEDPLRAFCGWSPSHAARGRVGVGAAALRARLRARERRRGADRLAARRAGAVRRGDGPDRRRERLAAICAGHPRRRASPTACARSRLERRAMAGVVRPGRITHIAELGAACERCFATCSAATSSPSCAARRRATRTGVLTNETRP